MDELLNTIINNIKYMKLDIETSPNKVKAISEYFIQLLIATDDLIKANKKGCKIFVNLHKKQKIKSFIKGDEEWLLSLYTTFFNSIINSYDNEKKELQNFYFSLNTMDELNEEKLYELWDIYLMFLLINKDRTNYIIKYKKIILNRIKNIPYNSDEEVHDINENLNLIKPRIRSLSKELK